MPAWNPKSGIEHVLTLVKNSPTHLWEVKAYTLSIDTNIRILPLKTLLVYLELKGIIKSMYTYFEEYSFKLFHEPEEIIRRFKGERRQLVQAMFDHSETKKVWTNIDIEGLLSDYHVPRARVVKALEYFDRQEWIELKTGQAVDVYNIRSNNFDVDQLAGQLLEIFQQKEKREVQRIHQMVRFFESANCLSRNLSLYFGEKGIDRCGHCSVCAAGKATIPPSKPLPPLSTYNVSELTSGISEVFESTLSAAALTKFFCGISSPMFMKRKIKQLPGYGMLEDYPYREVEAWVKKEL
jgi:ATP-dependent DNA helicase RecQ